MTTVKYVGDYNPDGTDIGQDASDKIGFYGTTPAVQPHATAQSAVATATLATVASTTLTGDDLTAINALVTRAGALTTLVNRLRADLVTLGLIKGSYS